MKKILLYIWQLPQHLLTLFLLIFWRPVYKEKYKHITVFRVKQKIGISLGNYSFVNVGCSQFTIKHEYGHSRQSLYLGPLYLIIVGLPSITMNILGNILYYFGHYTFHDNYYKRFPENWADKLGGVKRS